MRLAMPKFVSLTFWLLPAVLLAAPIPDLPFWQDVAVRIHHGPELTNATFKLSTARWQNRRRYRTDTARRLGLSV